MKNPYKFMQMPWEEVEIEIAHMQLDEIGAYMALQSLYWRSGEPLKDDDSRFARILRITPQRWQELKPIVMEMFYLDGDQWRHRRIDDLMQECRANSQKQSQRAMRRWAVGGAEPDRVVIPMHRQEQDDYPF